MKGISLILTLMVVAIALAITLGLVGIFVSSLTASLQIHFSTISFYVGDAGIEGALFADRNVGAGLADGFICNNPQGTAVNGDTCLDKLDNGGTYTYKVLGVTPLRKIESQGNYSGIRRSIEVNY